MYLAKPSNRHGYIFCFVWNNPLLSAWENAHFPKPSRAPLGKMPIFQADFSKAHDSVTTQHNK